MKFEVVRASSRHHFNYDITFKDEMDNFYEVLVHEELVLKFRLVVGKVLTEAEFSDLGKSLDYGKAYSYATYILASRMYTVKEVRDKLIAREVREDIIDSVISKLFEIGLLDDMRYAGIYVESQIIKGVKGPDGIRSDLVKKGISETQASAHVEVYTYKQQLEAVHKLAQDAIKSNKKYGARGLMQKLYHTSTSKGFDSEVVSQVLAEFEMNVGEDEILQRELEKFWHKYSKFSDYEHKQKVTQALARRGFEYDAISDAYQIYKEEFYEA